MSSVRPAVKMEKHKSALLRPAELRWNTRVDLPGTSPVMVANRICLSLGAVECVVGNEKPALVVRGVVHMMDEKESSQDRNLGCGLPLLPC